MSLRIISQGKRRLKEWLTVYQDSRIPLKHKTDMPSISMIGESEYFPTYSIQSIFNNLVILFTPDWHAACEKPLYPV
jgi:hypothetical protein